MTNNYETCHIFDRHGESCQQETYQQTAALAEVQKKIDKLEEKYFMSEGEMSRETFEKFIHKLVDEKQEILAALSNASENSSNLKKYFTNALEISSKLATGWTSSSTNEKEKLQKLVFPEGIAYDYKNGAFRTDKVNAVFRCIADVNGLSGDDKQKQDGIKTVLSSLVGMTGFEPATPTSRT